MNKIQVGELCLSCYHQIQRTYIWEDAPVYNDHDHPLWQDAFIEEGY